MGERKEPTPSARDGMAPHSPGKVTIFVKSAIVFPYQKVIYDKVARNLALFGFLMESRLVGRLQSPNAGHWGNAPAVISWKRDGDKHSTWR